MRSASRLILTACIGILLLNGVVSAAELSREEQIRIIEDFLFVNGQGDRPSLQTSLAIEDEGTSGMPHKCGMSAAADFAVSRSRMDRDLLISLGIDALNVRPALPYSYVSPSGRFKIHYDKTGTDAVYRANEDSDGDGVPNYVESTALIADSVWEHEITELGYPIPPSDSFYTTESDSAAYDVFLVNLAANFYGLAYPDSIWQVSPGHYKATSFIKLDNDYSQLSGYESRPLDAIRVTMAHEFFHAIQFGIDPFEAEDFDQTLSRRYWMELSAVWMEEEVFDDINDYYGYLPYFFEDVTASIQQFESFSDLHPYSCGIFGMFLSQRYGRDVIREVWKKCGEFGVGPHMLIAVDDVIDSISGGSQNLASAFAEFAQWNYFTGFRATLGPANLVYEEALEYPVIPDGYLNRNSDFQIGVSNIGDVRPEHMGAAYFRFEGGLGIEDQLIARNYGSAAVPVDPDTVCNLVIADSLFETSVPGNLRGTTELSLDWALAACPDLQRAPDTCAIRTGCSSYTRAIIDSTFNVSIVLDSLASPWYLSTIYQLRNIPDSHEVEQFAVPSPTGVSLVSQTMHPEEFCSYLVIVTPTTNNFLNYRLPSGAPAKYQVRYLVDENPDPEYRANCFGDSTAIAEQPSQLLAFPNPSVVNEMSVAEVTFRFKLETGISTLQNCSAPYMVVDLYTVAGERVSTIQGDAQMHYVDDTSLETRGEPVWEMTTTGGEVVASGVYIALGRLYCDASKGDLIAENKAKLALIR